MTQSFQERIATMTGIIFIIMLPNHDYMSTNEEVVEQKLIKVLDTAKRYHPGADILTCTLLPDKFDPSNTIPINNYIRTQCSRKQCQVVNTEDIFKANIMYFIRLE